jgi:UDP-3-O-[3-hydroxymyristoyl] N-acetylglucosamine deacetylase
LAFEAQQQRTLKAAVSCTGVGLHSGKPVTMTLVPANTNHGIVFVRVDLPGKPIIPVRSELVSCTALATTLSFNGVKVSTVEHVLAALSGLGIDNVRVELTGPEIPIMDGSAAPFAAMIAEAGIRHQDEPKKFLVITRPVSVSDGEKHATFTPGKHFRIECTIDFKHPLISDQHFVVDFCNRTFTREIASARTFGFLKDVEKLRALGLAQGGSLDNAVVVDDFNIVNPEGLRFPDEFVRHKLLDAVGDISLLGFPVIGTLTAYKTGHALNQKLVAKVLADPSNYELVRGKMAPAKLEDSHGAMSAALTPSVA